MSYQLGPKHYHGPNKTFAKYTANTSKRKTSLYEYEYEYKDEDEYEYEYEYE